MPGKTTYAIPLFFLVLFAMQQPATLPPLDPAKPFMPFRRVSFLRGPNMWSRRPCIEVLVDLGDLKDFSSEMMPGFNDRYKAWLPTVIEHRCSEGVRGGFFQRLDRGTYLAHILEHTTLELQTLAGCDVGFGRARETSEEGVFKVAIRYEEESVVTECLESARNLIKACIYDLPYDVATENHRLHDLADRRCLGPSTKAILNAGAMRNIPFRRLNAGSLVLMGQGKKQRRIWTAETDRTGAIAESIAQDKELTKQLLRAVGVPVPEGRKVSDPDDAVDAAADIESPVVVKPQDANHGRGIVPNLTQADEIRSAYHVSAKEGTGVIVERFVPGYEHRLLVVGDRFVAASKGEPVTVPGDGVRTVKQLIEEVVNADPRRGEDETLPLSPVEISESLRMILEHQRLTLDSIPAAGKVVLVKRHDNLSHDVTDSVHPQIAEQAVLAAKTIGLDIAGIDLVALDISCPLEDQGGAIVEVNAGPGLIMHLKPLVGKPRPVGEAIVEMMFGMEGDARIPVVCVGGSQGKTSISQLVRKILVQDGYIVGSADSTGYYVSDRQIQNTPADNATQIRNALVNPEITAAVFEVSEESILREGMGIDQCTIAIVSNVIVSDDLRPEFDIIGEEKFFAVIRTPVDVVMESGAAVLNASDPQCVAMKPLSKGAVVLYSSELNDALKAHIAEGGAAVYADNGQIFLAKKGATESIHSLAKWKSSQPKYELENRLAAIAAGWHLGVVMDRAVKALFA